jgi:hypothetical protein
MDKVQVALFPEPGEALQVSFGKVSSHDHRSEYASCGRNPDVYLSIRSLCNTGVEELSGWRFFADELLISG